MKFVKWLRAAIDELTRTPHVRSLERQLRFQSDAHDDMLRRQMTSHQQQRQDLTERLRDKDAVIADLRLRLAIAEADALREKDAKARPAKAEPVPEFDGPVPFQDELARMSLVVEEEEKNNAVS